MIRISACVIVKNEEKNIRQWLKHVKTIADEMIVVDTGSTDQTKKIACEAGAEVFDFTWQNDFSQAKNYALDHATGDWIIFLDADEYFTEDSQRKIRDYLNKIHGNYKVAGIITDLYNIDADNNNQIISKTYQVRIFRRDKHLRYWGAIHELLVNNLKNKTRSFIKHDFLIYHTGYSQSIIKKKMQRNLDLILKDIEKNGEDQRYYGYLLECYMVLEKYGQALHYGMLYLQHIEKDEMKEKRYYQVYNCKRKQGASETELSAFLERAKKACPEAAVFYVYQGMLYYKQKQYNKALDEFQQAVIKNEKTEKNNQQIGNNIGSALIPYVYRMTGVILEDKGKIEAAEKAYCQALSLWQYDEASVIAYWQFLRRFYPAVAAEKIKAYYKENDTDTAFLHKTFQQFLADKKLKPLIAAENPYEKAMLEGDYLRAAELKAQDILQIRDMAGQKAKNWPMEQQQQWNLLLPHNIKIAENERVSIMIPTYNRPQYFEQTLRSALAQTYADVEILVCDNSTSDDTEQLMQKYLGDHRVYYQRNRHAKCKADNFAPFEQLAKGKYLQWLMDDDLLEPDKLTKMVLTLQRNPEVTLVASQRRWIDEKGREIEWEKPFHIDGDYAVFNGKEMARSMLLNYINPLGEPSATLFRRRDLMHHYWRAESRGYLTISDVAMWCELMEKGDCAVFQQPLSSYRRHAAQEGCQADVVLLSRMEWFRLNTEYFQRGIFAITPQEYASVCQKLAEEEGMSQVCAQASASRVREYQAMLRQARKVIQEVRM